MPISLKFLAPYAKAVAAAGAALGVIGAALADGSVTAEEAVAVLSALGGVAAVYQARNRAV